MPPQPDQTKIIPVISEILTRRNVPHCLVGGVGVNIRVPFENARFTKDVDFAVTDFSRSKKDKICREIREKFGAVRFGMLRDHDLQDQPFPDDTDMTLAQAVMFAGRGDNIAVDLLLPRSRWIEQAIKRAQPMTIHGQTVLVAQREELVAAKIISFADAGTRVKDLADLKNLFLLPLDLERILEILDPSQLKWRKEFKDVLPAELVTRLWKGLAK